MESNDKLAVGLSKYKKSISLIWVAPIVAIIITSGMIWKNYVNAGTRITIIVNNGDGIRNGKTPIMYKGIQVGIVENVHIKKDEISKLELTALINKDASAGVTREGNQFWKVEPKISITEVSGLSTIISGVYIAVMPGANSAEGLDALPYQDYFVALDSPPVDVFSPGLAITVNTVDNAEMAIGAPVLYNKQAIGYIEDKQFSTDKKSIDLHLRIQGQYADLVHMESIFWKMNAVQLKAGLGGIKVEIPSFASFIAGGIGMSNTKESLASPVAKDKAQFQLFGNYEETLLAENEVVLRTKESSYKLEEGDSKVFYKGMEAGVVSKVEYDPATNEGQLHLKLHRDFRKLANAKSYFWVVQPKLGFDKISGLDTIIRGNYIDFITTDANAAPQTMFELNEKRPHKTGVRVQLVTDDIESLEEGAGLFYHSIEIGTISGYSLNKDKKSFTIDLVVDPSYRKLLNTSSVFYHKSGIDLNAGFDGVKMHTGSLETLLRGGIAVETPDFRAESRLKKTYRLYKNHQEIEKIKYLSSKGLTLTLLADRMGSLKKGSPLYYKQIRVGEVLSTKWDSLRKKVALEVFVQDEYAKEIHNNTLFYNASGFNAQISLGGLEIDTESIETIMSGGVSFFTPASTEALPARNHEQFLLYETKNSAMNQYVDISLISDDSYGLISGSTVMYKSVVIGHIESLRLEKEKVNIDLKIDKKYDYLVKEDTLFWTEEFQVSLQGVKNFSAALKGTYIVIKPGQSENKAKSFELMTRHPVPHINEEGLRVVVAANRLGGVKENTPVYYRQVRIGSVVQFKLSEDARAVEIELFIEPCHAHLVRKNSYFFNAGGIGMDIGFFSAKVRTETLDSILTGGIGVLTPDDYLDQAEEGHRFILNEEFEESALKWSPSLKSTNEACR